MIEQIYTYFTIEMIYIWLNLGVLPFWFVLIVFPRSKICSVFTTSILSSSFPLIFIAFEVIKYSAKSKPSNNLKFLSLVVIFNSASKLDPISLLALFSSI